MSFAWFLYTIVIMLVAISAAVSSMTVWVLTSRKDCLVAALGFLTYTLETAGVLFDEYMNAKPVMEELFATGLTHPVVNIVLGVVMVTSVWAWVAMRVYAHPRIKHVICFAGAYALVALVLAPVGNRAGVGRTLAYWSARNLLILGSLLFAWWWRTFKASETERIAIDRSRGFWRLALVLAILVQLEDMIVILLVRPNLQDSLMYGFFWHLTERNISDNVLMVACAVRMLLYNRDLMRIFASHPMEEVATGEQQAGSVRDDFDSRLLLFSDDHGMSKREREVLKLALDGKSVTGIASELFISEGTVKAHLHRIYTKAGVANRQDLVKAFWRH